MAFQFGFGDDDAEDEDDTKAEHGAPTDASYAVAEHTLQELLDTLPEVINYNTVRITSPTERSVVLLRRDLHDVRMQLLGEGNNDAIVDQLDSSDIRSGVYEGGFKTWECSQDLAGLLLDRGPRRDIDDLERCGMVIELGVGTALPTLILFRHALLNSIPLTFVLQDYNEFVLRLVTLPNILLTWAANAEADELLRLPLDWQSHNDIEVTSALLIAFMSDLKARSINLVFLSGPWSPLLASHIPQSPPDLGLLILAAETIYSPESTATFVDLLVLLLKRVKMAKAMVAAKRIYFGVGGSVNGLKEACRQYGAVASEIENHGVLGMDSGVGRALIEVQMF